MLEVDQGGRLATGKADVIVASVQSLSRFDTGRIEKYDPKNFKAIIIDEVENHLKCYYYNYDYNIIIIDLLY